jgi:hypothetical protein
MDYNKLKFKGNINKNYTDEILENKYPITGITSFLDEVTNTDNNFNKENYLEISHKYSPAYKVLTKKFKNGTFLSDNAFESLLVYHSSKKDNVNIDILNYEFNYNSLDSLKLNEKFDFIFSLFGLNFEKIYSCMPQLINYLKVEGILALKIPAYWYIKNNCSEIENTILNYSKQNDKKWIFVEPIDPIIEKNGGEIISLKEIPQNVKLNRFELANISSLNKLYDAIKNNNKAHLEITNLPEDNIELRSALLLIKKKKKTITKDNLFNL